MSETLLAIILGKVDKMRNKKIHFITAVFFFLYGQASLLFAEQIEQALPNGLHAIANYHKGDAAKPTVLILHGFLTTHNFNTILSATEVLYENGYSVLAPTLTLGINKRAGGLACNAIHLTGVEQDVEEIAFWVSWLEKNGHNNIVLIGHSLGSVELLAYALDKPDTKVKKIIAASLSYVDAYIKLEQLEDQISRAKLAFKNNNTVPRPYSLTYCQGDFVTTPEVYLSYVAWSKSKIFEAINTSPVPVHVIMGGKDHYFAAKWQNALKQTRAQVHIIEGASHFFDGDSEFDFQDKILEILSSI